MNNKELNRENISQYLAVFIQKNNLTVDLVAKEIGCSTSTLQRIVGKLSYPTNKLLKQSGIMFSIGFEKFKKLTKAEKEQISEQIGAVGGGILGFGGIASAISASGVAGLSAVGITSGLASIGAIIGGGMIAGVVVSAAIPIAIGAIGYKVVKGIKTMISDNKLTTDKFDPIWEIAE
ncbi:hypothetical protein HPE56_20075 [Maribacter sp. ANRC-HE7]|uniref:Helix-turn-helix n=1 Tax=Maribacter aquimaris TaxID=2737171 RepID=A0ABR7V5S1_9FLAO|nr:hypothetical protein [Maribacter aquimaris]MBD0780103.1 hypothetical protein [Maribacter aquimaris]